VKSLYQTNSGSVDLGLRPVICFTIHHTLAPCSCKGRHFSLLHHFRHRTNQASFPTCQSSKSCKSISDTFLFPITSQINANTLHAAHIVLLHCYLSILANTCRNSYSSQYNLVPQLCELQTVRNHHHRIALLVGVKDSYNVDLFWIGLRGSKVIGSQSPKILTTDLVAPRDNLLSTFRDPLHNFRTEAGNFVFFFVTSAVASRLLHNVRRMTKNPKVGVTRVT